MVAHDDNCCCNDIDSKTDSPVEQYIVAFASLALLLPCGLSIWLLLNSRDSRLWNLATQCLACAKASRAELDSQAINWKVPFVDP